MALNAFTTPDEQLRKKATAMLPERFQKQPVGLEGEELRNWTLDRADWIDKNPGASLAQNQADTALKNRKAFETEQQYNADREAADALNRKAGEKPTVNWKGNIATPDALNIATRTISGPTTTTGNMPNMEIAPPTDIPQDPNWTTKPIKEAIGKGIDEFNDYRKNKPIREEIGENISDPNNPIVEAIDERMNTPFENLIDPDNPDNLQNQTTDINNQLQQSLNLVKDQGSAIDSALLDPNSRLAGTRETIDKFGNKVESGAYGDVIDENISGQREKESQQVIDNAAEFANRDATTGGTLSSTKALKEGLTTPETELETALTQHFSDALSGKLTGEDSKTLENLNAEFDRGLAKRVADMKRAAGIRRGSGGGRFDRELGETLVDIELQKNTAISNLMANKDALASNYAIQNRLSADNLTQIALNAGLKIGDQNLSGNEQMGEFINTQIGNSIKENALKLDEARLDLDAQMSNIKAQMSQEEYESTYDQKERALVADYTGKFLDSIMTNLFGEANILLSDPELTEPSALEKGISGLADLAKFGLGTGLIESPF